MNDEIELQVQWSADLSAWQILASNGTGKAISPQQILDAVADYFLCLGWEYHSEPVPEEPIN